MYQRSQIQAFSCKSQAVMRACLHFASTCLKVNFFKKKEVFFLIGNAALNKITQ